jgi:hypothetical protein
MYDEPKLSEAQWALVVELLEQERNELPVEHHHSRNARVRAELAQRAEMVRELLDRLKGAVAVSHAP